MTDFQTILERIEPRARSVLGQGVVASYIPALACISPSRFGFALRTLAGDEAGCGDFREPFSVQSISKVFTLTLAMRLAGEDLWKHVGREPSGNPFNSLVQLESEGGVPRNPFINAGALSVADCLISRLENPKLELLRFVSELTDTELLFDEDVASSERDTGFRNAALANFMKSFGKLGNPVEEVLDFYFHQCALRMSCAELVTALGYLANNGVQPSTGNRIVTDQQARRINALMLTCGTYDAAGEFAFSVGLPCKSGVGGGIIAVVPDHMTLAVWGPALGPSGNSVGGRHALERFVSETGLSVF